VIYVGAKPGATASMARLWTSEEFSEGSDRKRPNVQVGAIRSGKLLLESGAWKPCIPARWSAYRIWALPD